jgi:hypothetical protein
LAPGDLINSGARLWGPSPRTSHSALYGNYPHGECGPLCIIAAGALVGAIVQGTTTAFQGGNVHEVLVATAVGALEGAILTAGAITGATITGAGLATVIEGGSIAGAALGEIGALGIGAGIHSIDVGNAVSGDGESGSGGTTSSRSGCP